MMHKFNFIILRIQHTKFNYTQTYLSTKNISSLITKKTKLQTRFRFYLSKNFTNLRSISNYIKTALLLFFLIFMINQLKKVEHISEFFVKGSTCLNYSKKKVMKRISHIPVFAVTNGGGQPFLTNTDKDQPIGIIFFSHEDAMSILIKIKANHQVPDARLFIMGLDKAYRMTNADPVSSGIRGDFGKDIKMIFRFYPDQKELKTSLNIQHTFGWGKNLRLIPGFIADGLIVQIKNESFIPVFLTKEDIDFAWKEMVLNNPDHCVKPEIEIVSVLDIIKYMKEQEDSGQEISRFVFFSPRKSVTFAKSIKSDPSAKIFFKRK